MATRASITGIGDLEEYLKEFGKLPEKVVNDSVMKAGRVILNAARANAPADTGLSKISLVIKAEKKKKKGRRIIRIRFKPDLFDQISAEYAKTNANRERETKRKHSTPFFYPSAMEYGYFIRGGKFVPGYHFLRDAVQQTKSAFEKKLFEELENALNKLARK